MFNTAGNFWKVMLTLVLTPYIISHIGVDRYGLWAIVSVISGYFSLLDFGIKSSFIKYISEFYAGKEFENINRLINTGVLFYAVFGTVMVAVACPGLNYVIGLFQISPYLGSEAYQVFLLGVVLFAVSNVFNVPGSVQGGLQRMDLTNKISIGVSIPMALGTVYFLENGYGLMGLMVNNGIVVALTGILNVVVAFRLIPELRVNPGLFDRAMFRKMFDFGYKVQIGNIADTITFQTDKLIMAAYQGMGMVGFYQLGSSVVQFMRTMPILMISALLPAASEMYAMRDHHRLRDLYVRSSRYLVAVTMPLAFFLIAGASTIMTAWMGQGYEMSALVIQILAVGYIFNVIVGVAVAIGAAMDRPGIQAKSAVLTIVSNIGLCLILVNMLGFAGIALAMSISLMVGPVYYFAAFHRHMKIPLSILARDILFVPLMVSGISAIPVFAISYGLSSGRVWDNPWYLVFVFLEGAIYVLVYAAAMLLSKYFDSYDMCLLNRYLRLDRIPVINKVIGKYMIPAQPAG